LYQYSIGPKKVATPALKDILISAQNLQLSQIKLTQCAKTFSPLENYRGLKARK
jgi:hypothetical protein